MQKCKKNGQDSETGSSRRNELACNTRTDQKIRDLEQVTIASLDILRTELQLVSGAVASEPKAQPSQMQYQKRIVLRVLRVSVTADEKKHF